MMTEAPTRLVLEAVDAVADRVVSAHAPYSTGCTRLSIADLDDAVREVSIDQLGRYIEAGCDAISKPAEGEYAQFAPPVGQQRSNAGGRLRSAD